MVTQTTYGAYCANFTCNAARGSVVFVGHELCSGRAGLICRTALCANIADGTRAPTTNSLLYYVYAASTICIAVKTLCTLGDRTINCIGA